MNNSSIYSHNVIKKSCINSAIKQSISTAAISFLKNNATSVPYETIKNLTLIIQKSMNDNKLTENIINDNLNRISQHFNNNLDDAKLFINYIIIMARHSSTDTTKINWFCCKDRVNQTGTIKNFLKEINKNNASESTHALYGGLKIISDIYLKNSEAFNNLNLNKFNLNNIQIEVKNDGYDITLPTNEKQTFTKDQFMSLSYTCFNKKQGEIKKVKLTEKILQFGVDISYHYLPTESQYKIYRVTNLNPNGIYAVDTQSFQSVLMWEKSNKSNNIEKLQNQELQELGRGEFGVVFKKTDAKAVKINKSRSNTLLDAEKTEKQKLKEKQSNLKKLQMINEHLLKVKFNLGELQIDEHFILGLHNTKDILTPRFMMPVINPQKNNLNHVENLLRFLHVLKIFNENGYFHPDLANNPFHYSSQNALIQNNYVSVTFDLDSKLEAGLMTGDLPIKDQWLWFACNMMETLKEKRGILNEHYNNNNNKAVSDDMQFLNTHFPALQHLAIITPTLDNKKDAYSAVDTISNEQIQKDLFRAKYEKILIIKNQIQYELKLPAIKVDSFDKLDFNIYLESLLASNNQLPILTSIEKTKLQDLLIIGMCQNIHTPIGDVFKLANLKYDIWRLKPQSIKEIKINLETNEIIYCKPILNYFKSFDDNGNLLNFDPKNLPEVRIEDIKIKIAEANDNEGTLVKAIYKNYSVNEMIPSVR